MVHTTGCELRMVYVCMHYNVFWLNYLGAHNVLFQQGLLPVLARLTELTVVLNAGCSKVLLDKIMNFLLSKAEFSHVSPK